jgi:hypothetical protein
MLSAPLTFDEQGYLRREGRRFVPVGVNYWPSSCGTEMWSAWPEAETRRDLAAMAALGLNAVRFFLRWDMFEPEPGQWNKISLDRLDQFLSWCREAGIYAQPTLFVGWMSGAVFWPEWKAGRNLFSHPELRDRSVAYAGKIAQVCRTHHGGLMGFDLGNELCCLAESKQAAPAEVAAWCAAVTGAIHTAFPESWSMAGNEQNQITSESGWRLDDQPGTSCLSMHAYPVPHWHPVPVDGLTDPLTQSLLPFYVKAARAFGPVMVQEFGTILTRSARRQRDYLDAVLTGCRDAGANGFLWWCWSDFTCAQHPYNKCTFEKELGLVDLEGKVKPGLERFIEFAREMRESPAAAALAAEVGLYWPKHYYARDNPFNPGNSPETCSPRLIMAHYLAGRAGFATGIVRHDALEKSGIKTLLIAGTFLNGDEIAALLAWVEKGGRVLWHGPDPQNMTEPFRRLAGFSAIDFRHPQVAAIEAFGHTWWLGRFPRGTRVDIELQGGDPLATASPAPLVIGHRVGRGKIITVLADIEGCVLEETDRAESRDRWIAWYRGMIGQLSSG